MQGFLDFPDEFYPGSCLVSSGRFSPPLNKEEGKLVTTSCNNPHGINLVTCKSHYLDDFLREAGGLNLDLPISCDFPTLPLYIPVLDAGASYHDAIPRHMSYVGVTLSDILTGGASLIAGAYHENARINFRTDLLSRPAFTNRKVILFLSGTDTLLESVWYRRDDIDLFNKIKQMGFVGAGGMNFSVMKGECAFGQALNIKRSLLSTALSEAAGTIGLPHVYAMTSYQVERWIRWFRRNPKARMFTMNCQLQRSSAEIDHVIGVLRTLLETFPYLRVIIQGFPINRLIEFGFLVERIHYADKMPIKFAHMNREMYVEAKTGKVMNRGWSGKGILHLLKQNVEHRCQQVESIHEQVFDRISVL